MRFVVRTELGILSGSAIFRVQGASLQGSSAAPVSTAQEEQKRSVSFTATTGAAPPPPVATPLVEAAVPPEAPQPTSNESIDDIEMEESDTTDASPSMTPFDALQLIRDSHFDSVSKGTIRTLMKIVTNILSNPGRLSCFDNPRPRYANFHHVKWTSQKTRRCKQFVSPMRHSSVLLVSAKVVWSSSVQSASSSTRKRKRSVSSHYLPPRSVCSKTPFSFFATKQRTLELLLRIVQL